MGQAQNGLISMNVRLGGDIEERIKRASYISNQSVSAFVESTLSRVADEIIARHQTIVLDDEERDFFLSLLEANDEPSEKSLAAAARYNLAAKQMAESQQQ